MTCSDERSSEKRDWNDLFARLCCVASYLRELDDVPGSDFTLDQELYDATFVFLTYDDSPDGRALRESKWPLVRRCLRKIDGYISDKEVFEAYARRAFDRDWLQATPEKRRELVNSWLFDKKPLLKSDRLANFAINMAQVISTDKRGDAKLNELIDYIVDEDSREIAFQLSEYVAALDDYSFSESPEVETLCSRLIDFVYDCYQAIRKRDEKKKILEAKAAMTADNSKALVEGTPLKAPKIKNRQLLARRRTGIPTQETRRRMKKELLSATRKADTIPLTKGWRVRRRSRILFENMFRIRRRASIAHPSTPRARRRLGKRRRWGANITRRSIFC